MEKVKYFVITQEVSCSGIGYEKFERTIYSFNAERFENGDFTITSMPKLEATYYQDNEQSRDNFYLAMHEIQMQGYHYLECPELEDDIINGNVILSLAQ